MTGYLIYDLDTHEYSGPIKTILYQTEFGAENALKFHIGQRAEVRKVEIVHTKPKL